MTGEQVGFISVNFDRLVLCHGFLRGVDDRDLEAIASDESRWANLLHEIRQQASFVRRLRRDPEEANG